MYILRFSCHLITITNSNLNYNKNLSPNESIMKHGASFHVFTTPSDQALTVGKRIQVITDCCDTAMAPRCVD